MPVGLETQSLTLFLRRACKLGVDSRRGDLKCLFLLWCRLIGYFYWLGRAALARLSSNAGGGDGRGSSSTGAGLLLVGTFEGGHGW